MGVAPFARHKGKQWPVERMRGIVEYLAGAGSTVYLFGGGTSEKETLREWARHNEQIQVAGDNGKGFAAELSVIRELDVMISWIRPICICIGGGNTGHFHHRCYT